MKKILFILLTILTLSCSKDGEGSIMGTASANDKTILSGITVKLFSLSSELLQQTETDKEGNFNFNGLDAENYYIGATITVDGQIWDTGNSPMLIYIGDEIQKEIALTLNEK